MRNNRWVALRPHCYDQKHKVAGPEGYPEYQNCCYGQTGGLVWSQEPGSQAVPTCFNWDRKCPPDPRTLPHRKLPCGEAYQTSPNTPTGSPLLCKEGERETTTFTAWETPISTFTLTLNFCLFHYALHTFEFLLVSLALHNFDFLLVSLWFA